MVKVGILRLVKKDISSTDRNKQNKFVSNMDNDKIEKNLSIGKCFLNQS